MNSPSILSNLSKQTMNTTGSHNVERINALADKLNQIQVISINLKINNCSSFELIELNNHDLV